MGKDCKKISLGLFLATFHINLGTVQIFPSAFGWLLVVLGVYAIAKVQEEPQINNAKKMSLILFVIQLLDLFGVWNDIVTNAYIVSAMVSAIELLFVFYFFDGMIKMLEAKGNLDYASENEKMLSRYKILYIIGILLLCIIGLVGINPLGSCIVVYMLVLRIYIIYRVYKLS
ncbi:hypothetical protein [Anaerosporobacter sp.]|uniref:hypothetical protein n=1 Tax=Anaerosporobacter sp. TaxID=1872529 RepID=UPI00286F0757|nr:hypothetical protein [Anaerosporobacter sp.]